MKNFLARFPKVTIENANDQRRSRLLNILLLGIGGITLFALVGITLGSILVNFDATLLYIGSFALLTGILISAWLNRRGKVLYAAIIFLAIIIVVFSIADTPEQTIKGRTLFMFVIPVLMSSFLIRPSAGFFTSGIVAGLHISIATLAPVDDYTPVGLIGFVAIALVAWLAASNLEMALNNLQKINTDLDRRVIERTQELAGANSQLRQQAKILEEANKKLRSLDELKSRFVSDVSHELRTPISNLSIYLEMIEVGTPEENARYLNVLRSETDRLSKLVSDVLDLSRMEMGTTKIEMKWLDLNQIVEKVVTANHLRAKDKRLEISFMPGRNIPNLWADANQITQVANNIIGNSISYTQRGSIQVSTEYNSSKREICFIVSDTGIGIDDADIPHLFERFYRGKQAGQSTIPGTGLGLAITKEIVERLQGTIEVQSTVGKGSIFKVRFPIFSAGEQT